MVKKESAADRLLTLEGDAAVHRARVARDLELVLSSLPALGPADTLAVDTETTGLFPYQGDRIMAIVLAWGDQAVHLPIAQAPSNVPDLDPLDVKKVIEALQDCQAGRFLYHNGVFDVAVLGQLGFVQDWARYWDTMIVAWMIDDSRCFELGLKHLCRVLLGPRYVERDKELHQILALHQQHQKALHKETLRAAGVPEPELKLPDNQLRIAQGDCYQFLTYAQEHEYGRADGRLTLRLNEKQLQMRWRPQAARKGHRYPQIPKEVVWREMAFCEALYRMTHVGVAVDLSQAAQLHEEASKALRRAQEDLGIEDVGNANAVRELIFETWGVKPEKLTKKKKEASVDKDVLAAMAEQHPGIQSLLNAREAKKVGDVYASLERYLGRDGRIHPGLRATSDTGRLSSKEPNLMAIPKTAQALGVFIAGPGLELVRFDLKSAELVILASLSGDPAMTVAIKAGRDLHAETAMALFGRADDEVRAAAKAVNFGVAYGRTEVGLARGLAAQRGLKSVTPELTREAEDILRQHHALYPTLWAWDATNQQRARALGYMEHEYWPGRYRKLTIEETKTMASNFLVQGGQAEYLKDLLVHLLRLDLSWRVVLPIHDELLIECEPGTGGTVHQELQQASDEVNPFALRLMWEAK